MKRLTFARGLNVFATRTGIMQPDIAREPPQQREVDHAR